MGKKHELVVEELPDRRLFVQFMGLTNGNPTYPSGRYHYTDAHEDGRVFIDFNKAYSPPCAFIEFATCTFAPQENHSNVTVEAGEIFPGNPHQRSGNHPEFDFLGFHHRSDRLIVK